MKSKKASRYGGMRKFFGVFGVATVVVASLLTTKAFAQNLPRVLPAKAIGHGSVKSDAAIFEKLKKSAMQHPTIHNKVLNPAPFSRGRMPQIIAALEKQKAAALIERAEIMKTAGKTPASLMVPAVQDAKDLNTAVTNSSLVTQSSPRHPVSAPGGASSSGGKSVSAQTKLPSQGIAVGAARTETVSSQTVVVGNAKTEGVSSQTNVVGAAKTGAISPLPTVVGAGSTTNAAKQTSLVAGKYGQSVVCQGPTIYSVNGQPSGATFSSDPQYNQYTIRGCGFGNQQGQTRIFGPFVERTLNLTIEFWSDSAIIAALDPNLSGEPDQQGTVNLVIAPIGAPQVQASGFNFFAVREQVSLPSFPLNLAHLAQVKDTQGWGSLVPTSYYAPANASTGRTVYQTVNLSNDCPALFISLGGPAGWTLDIERRECGRIGSGTDTFDLSNLPGGLEPYAFQISTQNLTQTECDQAPGSDTLYVDGSWNEGWTGNGSTVIQITTQSSTCHASGNLTGGGGTIGLSSYSLQIWVLRPRGVPLPAL